MTARWVVEQVAPARDVQVSWQPISLYVKNGPGPDHPSHDRYHRTHTLLRVLESVRTTDGNDGVFRGYWSFGARIHHDRALLEFDIGEALSDAGLDPVHASAAGDERWDHEIRARMDRGLALAGDDIGTPIIGIETEAGDQVGIFGPVITRVPSPELSLQLWDGMVAVLTVPGFWELKRTRTERPDLGERPA